MPKAFTQSNKDRIRSNLLQKGREYFIRYGLKKTSVDELAKSAGIAKGSFYKFFDSKEALLMAIHEASEERLRGELIRKIEELKNPAEKLRTFLKSSFSIIEDDPLLLAIFRRDRFDSLSDFMTSRQYEEHYQHNITFMIELIGKWQKEGIIRQLDGEIVSNLIGSTFFIFLQKEALGAEMYAKVTDMLVECLVGYLSEVK